MIMGCRVVLFLLNNLFWLFLSTKTCYGVESDINCLQALKKELKDPNDYLSSWVFDNKTQGFICKFNGIECWHPDEDKVLNIRLSNMGLKGQFPLGLKNCTSMTGLYLSDNNLAGPLPENIDHIIPYVVTLDLSSNHFSGNLTSALGNLTYLNVLNLQHNQFSGQIPGQIGRLARLTTFNVADNSLSGQIPWQIARLARLSTVSFADNNLSGQIPTFTNKNFSDENFTNNNGLCGEPLPKCMEHGRHYRRPPIIAIIFAAVSWIGITFAIIIIVVNFFCVSKKEDKDEGNKWAKNLKGTKGIMVSMFEKSLPKMSLFNLMKATNNFSEHNIIGFGKSGTIYKAILPYGSLIAVKRLQKYHHNDGHFVSKITTLASIRHWNLLPLLGFCTARKERLLIYKYMPRGTLYDQLHQVNYRAGRVMDWATRLRISIGVARGLMWLHHHCNPCIVHHNVNSKCILLDENYEPKISDFGFDKPMNPENCHWIISFHENFDASAYIPPEYIHTLVGTLKGDIYSFGMVLLELVSGKTPAQVAGVVQNVGDNTVEWTNCLLNMYAEDKSLIGRMCDGENEIVRFLKIAFACIVSAPENRPTMLEVYQLLSAIGSRYEFEDEDEVHMPSDNVTEE